MFRKVIAFVLTLTFLVQSVGLSQIQPLELRAAQSVQIEIPKEFGEIVSSPLASSKSNVIIHIQDAHGSYEAQKNIEKIIRHLSDHYGIKTLFLEGGAGKLAPEQFHFFDDRKLDLKVADLLMQRGAFTGAENFLLSGKAEGYGIEDVSFYRNNFTLFESAVNARAQADLELKKLKAETQNQTNQIFSKDARDFVKAWELHQSENSDWMRYLSVLDNAAQKHLKLDFRNPENQIEFPMLVRYFNLKERNVEKVDGERQAFLEFLKGKINPSLHERLSCFEESKTNPRFLFEELQEELSKKQIKLPEFPNFFRYVGNRMLQSELSSKELFAEMTRLADRILATLAKTPDERALIQKIRERILLEKLAHLELTREEWKALLSFPLRIGVRGKLQRESSVFSTALNFYRAAEAREGAFMKNIAAITKQNKIHRAIVVTGGFHTEGLEAQLKQQGYSFVTICPDFKDTENSRKNYLRAMLPETSQLVRELLLNTPGTFETLVPPRWSSVYRAEKAAAIREVSAEIHSAAASLGAENPWGIQDFYEMRMRIHQA
ncbi:MAG: hypothetical protein HZC17_04570, partial [Candidatus Omnitrophica bacterium]|nr:hypothetical protein [Candidatus Omnitrophota bacterium]